MVVSRRRRQVPRPGHGGAALSRPAVQSAAAAHACYQNPFLVSIHARLYARIKGPFRYYIYDMDTVCTQVQYDLCVGMKPHHVLSHDHIYREGEGGVEMSVIIFHAKKQL